MKYILGIDQGASKTHAILCNENGNILGLGKASGACHSQNGMDEAMSAIHVAVKSVLQKCELHLSDVSMICAGITGADWGYEIKLIEDAISKSFGMKQVYVMNDCIIALRAGTDNSNACVLCAGSGFNCAVRNGHDEIIYGYYVADEHQGGCSIGMYCIKSVFDSHIGIKQPTILTRMVLDFFNIDTVENLLHYKVNCKIKYKDYVSLPLLVEKAALSNDQVANEILEEYAIAFSKYAIAGMGRLNMLDKATDVVLSGSVFKCRAPILKDSVIKEIHSNSSKAVIVDAIYEPVVGAALTGLDKIYGQNTKDIYSNIENTAEKFKLKRINTN